MSTETKASVSIDEVRTILPVLLPPATWNALCARGRRWYQRAWTPLVLLWTMIFQRLNADHTCDAAVTYVLGGGADHLDSPHAVPLSLRLTSESTAAFCQGRARLPLTWVQTALTATGQRISSWLGAAGTWCGHPVALLDGSSVLLRPTPALSAVYASHQNQHGPTYWLGMRVLVGFCLFTGALLALAEGSIALSEQALVLSLLAQVAAGTVWVADRNFGVFSVIQAARQHQQHVVVRLNRRIACALVGHKVTQTSDWAVTWRPSRETYKHPGLAVDPIPGRVVCVRLVRPGFPPLVLYLFTTLTDQDRYPLAALVELYGYRWHVELDLRYVKDTLDMASLAGKTPDIVRKELYAGVIGYNLIRAFMTQAALQAGVSPLTLSFTQCWRRVQQYLATRRASDSPTLLAARTQRLLQRLARCRLPQRPPWRIEPRAVRRRPMTYPNLKGSRAEARAQARMKLQAEAKS